MSDSKQRKSNNRLDLLLDAAAKLFAAQGYRETTIREISTSIGMLPGSVYYHFSSKHELLLAVYEQGVKRMIERLEAAPSLESNDPWKRVEATLVAHLDSILEDNDYASVMISVRPDNVPEVADELRNLRNRYESRFRTLIDELPLPEGTDRHLLRLMLIGAANWTQFWYRPGRQSPEEIGETLINFLRKPLDSREAGQES